MNNDTAIKFDMDKTTSNISYGTSGATAIGGLLSMNEIALAIGIFFTALTFLVTLYFQHRRDQREQKRLRNKEERDMQLHAWAKEQHEKNLLRLSPLDGCNVDEASGD
ncbi:HP1 family phage holin [Rheinheimera sp. MMS21-TC3]|uniref:HP1 family phage holin n=1 Tax=Rheinheimera sp. MMS21-TC3 TaxID=3072790 RepID=UPI0028C48D0A|nr:HP1 family phage holin [Rheinheimera sp. MMS21-TC3]WNO60435.1 HP1 family phage holin [Rheinheimera sp. MMS21-TC3]